MCYYFTEGTLLYYKEGVTVKKAIFGGTFDPIHIGHVHIAYEALYNLHLDKILFMPAGNPPNKINKKITDAQIRYDLVKKAIEHESHFEISDYEINKKENSYTYETLELFSESQTNIEWYFLIGGDSLMDLDNWKNVDRILKSCKLVVYGRAGFTVEELLKQKNHVEQKFNGKVIFLNMPIIDISSTNIRGGIKKGRNVDYLLPKGVEVIIDNLQLYK
ncbi:nicotinate-nucleotide adenylyltransferase [Clostridium sp. CM028]|uniref:nicotinate-nucleotide adenylyltransferase n=1 Tax=unclassified Clostridium TaxID=2614128 RepID=UPI001C0DB3D0|nr:MULTISPECIES: nicotinate-nucleotide adenylyltransferase [unclassified Clostridium]MBU3090686.1 nicotinate-nucleotide adenylyltransferase [Clostridium sp. CF011]MBW9144320.1 nicotinate-nucleotide adenylyltransferase [Clostridium sp. CM027]MBW9149442.1 nicotinate-nucleotide adenylyltransferase [Clostridium sp. CM028]UVE41047.1 nicotinate-nucleotide adenylyltransferase [Clostridium sp. CM027]WAG70037.1 nicotinate-nucleotide adenylyltransferase [Clostridium sp. CF011]